MGESELDFFLERRQIQGSFNRHIHSHRKIDQLTNNSALVSLMSRSKLQKYCDEKGLPITGKTDEARHRAATRALEGAPEQSSKLPTFSAPNLTEERWWPTIRQTFIRKTFHEMKQLQKK
jgi:hypothetical protein